MAVWLSGCLGIEVSRCLDAWPGWKGAGAGHLDLTLGRYYITMYHKGPWRHPAISPFFCTCKISEPDHLHFVQLALWDLESPGNLVGKSALWINLVPDMLQPANTRITIALDDSLALARIIHEDVRVQTPELLRRGGDALEEAIRGTVDKSIIRRFGPGHEDKRDNEGFCTVRQAQRVVRSVPLIEHGRQRLEDEAEDDVVHACDGRVCGSPLVVGGLNHGLVGHERLGEVDDPTSTHLVSQASCSVPRLGGSITHLTALGFDAAVALDVTVIMPTEVALYMLGVARKLSNTGGVPFTSLVYWSRFVASARPPCEAV